MWLYISKWTGKNRGILRYALPANMIITVVFHRLEWFIMTGTVACKVFDQTVQLYVGGAFGAMYEPQMPVFVMPVTTVKPRFTVLMRAVIIPS